MWGALSDKRTGLSFTTAAGPHQRSHSPTTRRVTVEVCDNSFYILPVTMENVCLLPVVRETRLVLNWSVGIYLRGNVF
jgi:hypothetical protein